MCHIFSYRGSFYYGSNYKIQSKMIDYGLFYLEVDNGQILDIGYGNGVLSIKIAKKISFGLYYSHFIVK